jgi:two-component system cell cycle response regulator DivK
MRKKVAIVDDNPDNRELVRYMLADAYDVSEYDTGQQAIAAFMRNRPDLVLLDISLPQMDGPELVKIIRSDKSLSSTPVIALTAHAMRGDRERYLAIGFNDYIAKPILDERVLLNTIEHWLGSGEEA